LNTLFAERDWPFIAYGDFSMVRILPGYTGPRPQPSETDNDGPIPFQGDVNRLDGPKNTKPMHAMRQAMLLNGVDLWGFAGMTSCEHTDAIIDHTVTAVAASVELLLAEGLV
jgi:glutamate-1-semialdehyde 2,1-aminomutase